MARFLVAGEDAEARRSTTIARALRRTIQRYRNVIRDEFVVRSVLIAQVLGPDGLAADLVPATRTKQRSRRPRCGPQIPDRH